MTETQSTSAHGTRSRYVLGCRCAGCRRANLLYGLDWKSTARLTLNDPRHGTINGYSNYQCRCGDCRAANAAVSAARRARLRGWVG